MKINIKLFSAIAVSCLFSACTTDNIVYEDQAGNLSLSIDNTGKIVSLKDESTQKDYIDDESYLITCNKYGNDTLMLNPISAKEVGDNVLELTFPENITLKVAVKKVDDYFRMEIIDANPVSEVSYIKWGPYYTTMQSFIGTELGIVRSEDFTVGLLTLDPNTDYPAERSEVAQYTENGASLRLYCYDHTRGVFRDHRNLGRENKLRHSIPIPVTVVGSKVALYSSKSGYNNELDAIEKIVLNEGLPHPTINGVWNKRTREQARFCLWSFYKESDFDEYLDLAKTVGAGVFCNPAGYFKNWGHFDIDLNLFPSGIEGLKKMSDKATEAGIGTTFYTLTTFTKPITGPEPYLAPVPDARFATWRYKTTLAGDIKADDKKIAIKNGPNIMATAKEAKSVRLGNELILYKEAQEDGDKIILSDCERGIFYTDKKEHAKDTEVQFPYFKGYNNYFPGTIDFLEEESDNAFKLFNATNQKMFMVDGFESCMEAGYLNYGQNKFADRFYKNCVANNKEIYWTGSRYSPYSWHYITHISWGESDLDKGIRGTMLDYRLALQVMLGSSLMPKKLGQYRPDKATVADIEWLMGLSTGYDSGVDFYLNLEKFKANPNHKEIIKKMALWSEARSKKVFTEEQLRGLRQTDREYTLSKNADGTFNLKFVGFWRHELPEVLPADSLPVKSLSGSPVRPCSIDWTWAHNPAPYYEIILSNDMIHETGAEASEWKVTYPKYVDQEGTFYPTKERYFQYVIRVPESSPCGVKKIDLTFNGYKITIPMSLKPGQYLTIPQLVAIICSYDKEHNLLEEKQIRGDIPSVRTGESAKVTIACTPDAEGGKPQLIMNMRCQNGFFYPDWLGGNRRK